jgi:hypothetical protein
MRSLRVLGWAATVALPLLVAAQQIQSLTYVLQHRDVRSVLARVSEELGPDGQVTVEGSGNRITVRDDAQRLQKIRRLLADLDAPARHFALANRLEVLPQPSPNALFKEAPGFVDMTQWAQTAAPAAAYEAVMDLFEGQKSACQLGKAYRLSAQAQGYDPSRRRLALQSLALDRIEEGRPGRTIFQGAAVLPEGAATLFLIQGTKDSPALRLRTTPTLLPSVSNPEVR